MCCLPIGCVGWASQVLQQPHWGWEFLQIALPTLWDRLVTHG